MLEINYVEYKTKQGLFIMLPIHSACVPCRHLSPCSYQIAAKILSTTILLIAFSGLSYAEISHKKAFNCERTFHKNLDINELVKNYGRNNITREKIHLGEGFFQEGTVLFFDSPENRVEILWHNEKKQKEPSQIRITGNLSNWITGTGLSLGTALSQIEEINKYPFRLAGFGWDYSGTILSWGVGNIGKYKSECKIIVRLRPISFLQSKRFQKLYNQVIGSREYSSGHLAMQALNPRIYQIILYFEKPKRFKLDSF